MTAEERATRVAIDLAMDMKHPGLFTVCVRQIATAIREAESAARDAFKTEIHNSMCYGFPALDESYPDAVARLTRERSTALAREGMLTAALRIAEEHERPPCVHVPGEPSRYEPGVYRCSNYGCGISFSPGWEERWHPRWARYRAVLTATTETAQSKGGSDGGE